MPLVAKHLAVVASVERLLPDVFTIGFSAGDRAFHYRPGQFLHLALEPYDPARPWPESRCFSIQTPPGRQARNLQITFATKGAFTRRMAAELAPGREVWLKLPYGDLFQADDRQRRCVFIAGGTGVTPFLSLFLAEAFAGYPQPCLYLGVRSAAYHVFADQLAAATRAHPAFAVEVFRQDTQGTIPIDDIAARHGREALYFLSGPEAMIKTFRAQLLAYAISPSAVRSDDWG